MLKEVKENPLISVITVVFNAKDDLEYTLKSIISQEFKSFEVIVIDGGSTDGTLQILEQYSNHIDFWVSEPDDGIYHAMNKGIHESKGKWLNFMNAGDCYFNNNVLQDIFSQNNYNDEDILIGNSVIDYKDFSRVMTVNKSNQLWKGLFFKHQSAFIKRSYHSENLYNIKNVISADFEFFYTAFSLKKKILFLNVIIAIFNSGGISDTRRVEAIKGILNSLNNSNKLYFNRLIFFIFQIKINQIKSFIKKILPAKVKLVIHRYIYKIK